MLAQLKGLRGTALDLFGYSDERRMEKALLSQYEGDLDTIAAALDSQQDRSGCGACLRAFDHPWLRPCEAGERRPVPSVERATPSARGWWTRTTRPCLQAAE